MKKVLCLILALAMCLCTFAACAEETIDTIMNAGTAQAFKDDPVSDEDLTVILQAGLSATSAINQQPWFFAVITNKDVMAEIGSAGFGGGAPGGFTGGAPEGMPAGDGAAPAMPEGSSFTPPEGMTALTGDGNAAPAAPAAASSGAAKAALGDSPVAIVVYLDESGMGVSAFDCGLACQNMFIAANALGYGAKIVSSPTMTLNGAQHDELCEKLGVDTKYTAVAVLLIGVADDEVDAATAATVRDPIDAKVSFIK